MDHQLLVSINDNTKLVLQAVERLQALIEQINESENQPKSYQASVPIQKMNPLVIPKANVDNLIKSNQPPVKQMEPKQVMIKSNLVRQPTGKTLFLNDENDM